MKRTTSVCFLSLALAAAAMGCGSSPQEPSTSDGTEAVNAPAWSGWYRVPGNTDAALSATKLGNHIYLFAKGLDGAVYVNQYSGGTMWSGWTSLGGHTDTSLASTRCFDGMHVFQKGTDGKVYESISGDGRSWSGWMEVPGGGQTDVALNATCLWNGWQGGLRLYMKGLDGHVYENVRTPASGGVVGWSTWTGWHEVGDGWVTNVPLGSFQTNDGHGEVVLLFKGLNNHSYFKSFHADSYTTWTGSWSAWSEIGGTTDKALAGDNGMILAKGINDMAGYYQYYTHPQPGVPQWNGWGSIGAGTTNASYAVAYYDGLTNAIGAGYYVFAKGINDNGIYMKSTAAIRNPPPPPPPPPPGPVTSTAPVWMNEQPMGGEGYIPWFAEFGQGISGTIKGIQNPSTNPFVVQIVKYGHSTAECGNPNALVTLFPGGTTTDMSAIYGNATPALPVPIIACAGGGAQIPPRIFELEVTYTHQ